MINDSAKSRCNASFNVIISLIINVETRAVEKSLARDTKIITMNSP